MRKYRLLIIDDEPSILKTYGEFFALREFEVETASNGIDGLDQLLTGEFDVALIDIRMPDMDGIEVARRAVAEDVDASLIILTGHGSREEAVAALNSGVDAWFDKISVDMGELLQRVRQLSEVIPLEEIRGFLSTPQAVELIPA